MSDPVTVEITRGPLVESRHRVDVCVVDAQGGIIDEAMPAMDAAQKLARANTRVIALMQQIGGDTKAKMTAMQKRGVAMRPVSMDQGGRFIKLNESEAAVELDKLDAPDDAWVNVYRRDDWSAVAMFYLDKPENGLPPLAPVAKRTEAMK